MDAELIDVSRALTNMPTRPHEDAPSRTAPYEARAEWSSRYVAWFIEQTDEQSSWASDIDATHRYEIEFNSCVIDPELYERQTQQELTPAQVH